MNDGASHIVNTRRTNRSRLTSWPANFGRSVSTTMFSFSQGINCNLAGLLRRLDSYYLLAAMAVAPLFYLFSLTPAMNDGASHIMTNTRRTNWSRTLPIIRRTAWSGRTEFQPPRLGLRLFHPSFPRNPPERLNRSVGRGEFCIFILSDQFF